MSTSRRAPSRPGRWARAAVTVATRVLPAGEVRARYRREFIAELTGMPLGRRSAHLVQLLLTSPALRAAVLSGEALLFEGPAMATKPLGCRLNVHHRWKQQWTDDGGRYHRCARCGTDKNEPLPGPGDWLAPVAMRPTIQ